MGLKPKAALMPDAGNQRLRGRAGVVADDGGPAADDVAAPGKDAGVQHAQLHGVAERAVVHLHGIQRVGEEQERLHVLVGLSLGPRLPRPLHADVAVRVDEGRGDDGELAEELALGLHGGALHDVPLEHEMNVAHQFVARVEGLGEKGFHCALSPLRREYSETPLFDQDGPLWYNQRMRGGTMNGEVTVEVVESSRGPAGARSSSISRTGSTAAAPAVGPAVPPRHRA